MRSADRHLRERELLALALGPSAARDAHVESCPECRRRVEGLVAGREHLADLENLESVEPPGAAPAPTPAISRLGGVLEEAEDLVRSAETGEDLLADRLEEAARRPGFPEVALHAAQVASRVTVRRPQVALAFAGAVRSALPPADGRPLLRLVEAELRVLESQAHLYVGGTDEARRCAEEGLRMLEESDAPLLLVSRARYYLGSALWGETRYADALRHLAEARDGFAEDGQDAWVGRAQAAIGLVHFSEARFREALRAFDAALERLDPEIDPGPVASTQQNRAGILMNLGRLAEARSAFGQALELAVHSGHSAAATSVRVNLLNLGLEEGSYEDVRTRGEKLVAHCDREGLSVDAYYARQALAEAYAALGNYGAVRSLVEAIRADAPPEVREDPDALALLGRLDAGDHEMAARLRRLRHYLSGRDRFEVARRA